MSTNDVATGVAIIVTGYLLGAVPVGLLVARWQRGIDIRRYGSGSTGATNVLRALGWKASAVVFAGDLVKAMAPVLLARVLTGSAWIESSAGVAAVMGHCWPVYTEWKGGRGATSSLGGLFIIQPFVAVACALVAATGIAATRFASVGSLVGAAFGGIVMAVLVATGLAPLGDVVYVIGAPSIVFVRHYDNLRRLLAGTERRVGDHAGLAQGKNVS